jgi:CSLREA domain-containing protein
MPTEALPTEAAPTDVPPTEAAPTEAPVEVVPTEAPVVTEVPVEVTPVPTENRVIVTPDVVATDAPEAPQVAQTFVVNSLGDQGDAVSDGQCDTVNGAPFTCTLRAAIDEANATTDADTIRFNIPGPGAKEIILGSTLTITNPVTIDGRTQPGYPAVPPPFTTPLIGIDGPGGLLDEAIGVNASNSAIIGLAIYGSGNAGIMINGSNNRIERSWIGLDLTGADAGNLYGVYVVDGTNNRIGGTGGVGNVVSGNTVAGVSIDANAATLNRVIGNRIGTNAAGTAPIANGIGLSLYSNTLVSRNLISGNTGDGIFTQNALGPTTVISGNRIGTNAAGLAALANGGNGIDVNSDVVIGPGNVISGNGEVGILVDNSNANGLRIEGNIIGLAANGNTTLGNINGISINAVNNVVIGGVTPSQRNVVSGNYNGIQIINSVGTRIVGNYVGTDSTGLQDRGNANEGIILSAGTTLTRIGGRLPGERNVISGNGGVNQAHGIVLLGTDSNWIVGNFIGVNAAGGGSLPNTASGIGIYTGSDNNVVGGTAPGAGNRIANSGAHGVHIGTDDNDGSLYNRVTGNSIYNNSLLGINIGLNAVLENDTNAPNDSDGGANGRQNYPVLSRVANLSATQSRYEGYLESESDTVYRLAFYASPACDPSGNGEGRVFLGVGAVSVYSAEEPGYFGITLSRVVPSGWFVTATAQHEDGATSEFSKCLRINTAVVGRPVVITPANGAVTSDPTPDFDWATVPGADSYRLIISRANTIETAPDIVTLKGIIADQTTLVSMLDTGELYFWRVAAVKDGVIGPFSAPRRLFISP